MEKSNIIKIIIQKIIKIYDFSKKFMWLNEKVTTWNVDKYVSDGYFVVGLGESRTFVVFYGF